MRGFIPHSSNDGRKQPWEYLPCGAIKPSIGMALKQSSGVFAIASGTDKPTHISMFEAADTLASGTIIPVIAVTPDMIFEVTNSDSLNGVNIGEKVTISSETTGDNPNIGCQVTGTTTNGKATIVDKVDGTGTGNPTLVKFE